MPVAMCKHPTYKGFSLSEVGNRILKRPHASGHLGLGVDVFNQRGPTDGQHSTFAQSDPIVMNNIFFFQTLPNFLSDNSTVCWSTKPSIVLVRMRFKDSKVQFPCPEEGQKPHLAAYKQ